MPSVWPVHALLRLLWLVLLPAGEDGEGGAKLSKKQRKLLHRLKIAELKQQCPRPDVVKVWDVTAPDPHTLVTLKVRPGSSAHNSSTLWVICFTLYCSSVLQPCTAALLLQPCTATLIHKLAWGGPADVASG